MAKTNEQIKREVEQDQTEGATRREAQGLAIENSGRVGVAKTAITNRAEQGGNT